MLNEIEGIQIISHNSKVVLKDPICIIGMPGIADVGKFAIDSLIGQLKAENLFDIIFDEYPAGAIVDDSLLTAPKAEILYYKDPEAMRDILLITADAQSLSPRGIYKISNFLSELIHQFGVNLIIALGAYPINGRAINSKNPNILATSTNKELLDDFLIKNECKKI